MANVSPETMPSIELWWPWVVVGDLTMSGGEGGGS